MYEFDSVSVSTYEASSLAAKLTEKSGDGWEIVAIVPTGSDITAYVKRSSSSDGTTATTPAVTEDAASTWGTSTDGAATTAAVTATEPAGWGSAPESTTTPADTGASTWGPSASTTGAAAPVAAAPATPSVPAGWYADPANRYELRYWDGSAWTEHVSRAGQQYTDPPVA